MLPRRCRFSSYANVLALHKITRKLPNSPPFLPVSLSVEPLYYSLKLPFLSIHWQGPSTPPLYSAQHCSKSLSISSFITFTIQVFLWNRASRCNTEHKRSDDCARNSTENENVLRMSLLNKLYNHFFNRKNWNEKTKTVKALCWRLIVKELPKWNPLLIFLIENVGRFLRLLLHSYNQCLSVEARRGRAAYRAVPIPKFLRSPPPHWALDLR